MAHRTTVVWILSTSIKLPLIALETGVNVVTLTAVDPSGNSSSVTADITVLDTISPSVISQNSNRLSRCGGLVSITAGQADNGSSDNCSVDLSLSQSDFTCEHEGTNTVALLE